MSDLDSRVRASMRVLVSLILLFAGIAIVTAPNFAFENEFSADTQVLAAGWVGAVIGYWLS